MSISLEKDNLQMKIALIGADGQLGSDLKECLQEESLSPLYYPDFDITQPEKTQEVLSKISPDVVINTAAYNRVDDGEENLQECFSLNSFAVRDLAQICGILDCVLVHFSTDYVFDGKKNSPYVEEDHPNPLSVYGVSKYTGELFLKNEVEKYFLIRTCGLYGKAGCWGKGKNFVDTMVSLAQNGKTIKVINDQVITPTYTAELAQRVKQLIQTRSYGIYHLTNEGQCTWFEFAQRIFEIIQKNPPLIPVDSRTYGAKAPRPYYSVLENKNAKKKGIKEFSPWSEALEDYLRKKGYV